MSLRILDVIHSAMDMKATETRPNSSAASEPVAESNQAVDMPSQLRLGTVLTALFTISDEGRRTILLAALCFAAMC